jgi:hypothetical protein
VERDIWRCCSCGWKRGKEVEAGGIYYCPNKNCHVTGAWNKRLEAGYQDDKGNMSSEQVCKMKEDLDNEIRALLRCRRWVRESYQQEVGEVISESAELTNSNVKL